MPAFAASSSVAFGGGLDDVVGLGFDGVLVEVDWRRARDRFGESSSCTGT